VAATPWTSAVANGTYAKFFTSITWLRRASMFLIAFQPAARGRAACAAYIPNA